MARILYGGSPADVIAQVTTDDGDYGPATGSLSAWDSSTGGTQLTDLQTTGNSAISVVTPDSLGRVIFQGPDGYVASIWLQDASGTRWRIDPANLASRTAGVSSVTVDGVAQTGAVTITSPTAMSSTEAAVGTSVTPRLITAAVLKGAVQTSSAANVYMMPVWNGTGTQPARPVLPANFFVIWRQPLAPPSGGSYALAGDEWETTA